MIQRVIVVSDTHGGLRELRALIQQYQNEAVCFIHCGDGEHEIRLLQQQFPNVLLYSVAGNCDFDPELPVIQEITVAGKKICFTHGHRYEVAYGVERLAINAKAMEADIVLYGHTHYAETGYEDGLYIMNPGSLVRPRGGSASFGVIDIGEMGIVCNIVPASVLKW